MFLVDFWGLIRDSCHVKRTTGKHPEPLAVHPLSTKKEFKRGSIRVNLYPTWNRFYRGDGESRELRAAYPQFTLTYFLGTRRVKRKFNELGKAEAEARAVLDKLAKGDSEALRLTGKDAVDYAHATGSLRQWNSDAELGLVIAEYIDAVKLLPDGVSIREAVRNYVNRHASIRESRTVAGLVDEFISAKEGAGKGWRYLNDMRVYLGDFKRAFHLSVEQITAQMLQKYIDGLAVGNRAKLNRWRLILTALRFAVKRKYAPRELLEELEGVERPQAEQTKTQVFTPDELREMFDAARPSLVPWLAIAAFTGLRTAEILRLDWSEVKLPRRFVEVTAGNAKTAARRTVPMGEALIAWLQSHARTEGRLACFSEENKFCSGIVRDVNCARRKAGNRAKFKWKRNGLRHAYCSYRLAVLKDVGRVALEAGNSANMIFRHYRELVSEEEAARWFNTLPVEPAQNIISLHRIAEA